MHEPAASKDVHEHEYEDGLGPDPHNLAFDLTYNYSSPWNMLVLEHLL